MYVVPIKKYFLIFLFGITYKRNNQLDVELLREIFVPIIAITLFN